MFEIDQRILNDSVFLKEFELSNLYIKKDGENPWCILVPRKENVVELTDLNNSEQEILLSEINYVMAILKKEFSPDKINIGALGNIVAQFHFHIIARYKNDRAWPNAIWGTTAKNLKSESNKWHEQIHQNL
jgi:diadenosine tetraphosphate (Ap4A) HIT family hydrolase